MPDFTSSDAQVIFGAGLFVVIAWAVVHLAFYLTGARDKDRQARELAEHRQARELAEHRQIQRYRAIQFLRIHAAVARMRVLAFDKFGINREMTPAEQREFEELDDLIRRIIMATAPVDVERDRDGIQNT